jgi:1-acyl-sn-glycerol-3-phosphate acyltransferase
MTNPHDPPRIISFTRAFVGYSGYGLACVVFVLLLVPLSLLAAPFARARRALLRKVLRTYCAFLTRAYLPMLRVYRIREISGFARGETREPRVYVANHRGRLDALLLLGLLRDTGVVIKSKYARTPLYASMVKHLDFVSVDTSSLESLACALDQCKALVGRGRSLLIFPEGTRAASGKLLPFRDFAFRIAIDTGAGVAPVVVHSDLPFMAKIQGSYFPRWRFNFTVRFLPCVKPLTGERPADFAGRVRAILGGELAMLDKGTVWETAPEKGL